MRYRTAQRILIAAVLASAGAGASAASQARQSKVADAAEQRATTAMTALIKQGADVNAPQPDGARALHWAAHWDDVAMATALLRAGADPNAVNDYGMTPLLLAATNGSARMVSALVQAGANPNAALPTGQTVLMTAARTGSVPTIEALVAAGAALEATHSATGQTALMWAIAERHPDAARALIAHGASVTARTKNGFTPLLFAAREGDIDTARLLLAKDIAINESSPEEGFTPLLVATVRGHVALARLFLERGAQPDGNLAVAGFTPLHWAVTTLEITPITYPGIVAPGEWEAMAGIPDRDGKLVLVNALLAHGADVNVRMTKPMILQASMFGGATTSSPGVGSTPFLAAAGSADVEVMRLLVAHGADPLVRAPGGATAAMVATNADVEVCDRLTEAKRLETVRLAWQLGNNLEAGDDGGNRAMHLAARHGFHDIITFLVQHGADVNAKTRPRNQKGYGNSMRFVEAQTPLGLAEGTLKGPLFYQRPATADFLRKLGAKSEGRFYPVTVTGDDAAAAAAPQQAK